MSAPSNRTTMEIRDSLYCAILASMANKIKSNQKNHTTNYICKIIVTYDEAPDLLLNVDNKHLLSYTWLFDILHDIQETRFPLAAAFRSTKQTRKVCSLIAMTISEEHIFAFYIS